MLMPTIVGTGAHCVRRARSRAEAKWWERWAERNERARTCVIDRLRPNVAAEPVCDLVRSTYFPTRPGLCALWLGAIC